MKVISVWAILLAGFRPAHAQTPEAGTLYVESKVELKGGDDPAADESTWTADLEYLIRHPINIANASPDKLRGCGLFSEMQVAGILNHRQKFGDLISVEELQRVSGFSESVVRSLLPYIICETTVWSGKSVADVFAEGEHYLLYRVGRVVEEKQGHAYGPYSAYKGSPFSSLIRYRYAYRNSLSVNITAEKDPGEEFFTGSNKKGFDFYSASLALMNHKWLKTLVAGDYQVSYGQGLVMGSAPGGFSGDPVFSKRNFSGIRPYKSSAESGFQRGVALSAGTRNGWTSDLFFSAVKLDGNLRSAEDSLYEVNSVSSFQSSGYHRTWSEILDKGVVSEKIGGARLAKVGSSFGAGVTAVNVSYSNRFEKTNQPYNQFDFAGRSFARYGSDFWLLFRNLIFYGEVAFSSSFNPAFAGGVMVSADKNLLFSGSVRKYPRDHVAMLSSGPGQRSANANEEGVAVSALLNFSRSLKVSGMFDMYRFPWLIYDNNTLVTGHENSVQFTWSPARKFEFYLRWRYESFSSTAADPDRKLDRTQVLYRKGIRAHGTYQLTDQLSAKTRMEWVSGTASGELKKGVMFFQDLNWKPLESRWELSLRYAIFETDGYDARIYAYETDVPGSYSVPAYYYKGSRYYIMIRFKSSSSLSCWLKYGAFVYTNRNSVGSGYEEIPGNKKSEVKLQIRYEFE